MSVQVACELDGTLAWIFDRVDAARHHTFALRESGVLVRWTRRTGLATRDT
jgi:hypothetical protein